MTSFGINFDDTISIKTQSGIGRELIFKMIAEDIVRQGFNVKIEFHSSRGYELKTLLTLAESKHNDNYENIVFVIIDNDGREIEDKDYKKFLYDIGITYYKKYNTNKICIFDISTLSNFTRYYDYEICFDEAKNNGDRIIYDLNNKKIVGLIEKQKILDAIEAKGQLEQAKEKAEKK